MMRGLRAPGMTGLYVGIFLLAGAVLLLEVALTRVFAIMLWHHLAYMVIAVAMLGFGAAGSLLTLRGTRPGNDLPGGVLPTLTAGFGIAAVVMLALATRLPIDTLALWTDKANLLRLGLLYALLFLPFLLGGAAIGLLLSRLAGLVNRLYFFDLLGSAAGGAASVWLLAAFGSSATVCIAGALGLAAAAAFAWAECPRRGGIVAACAAGAVLLAGAATGALAALGLEAVAPRVPYAPGKEFARYVEPGQSTRLFSPTAEVEVGPSGPQFAIIGGNFGEADSTAVTGRLVGQDGTAPSMLFENAVDLDAFPFLDDSQTAAAHVALEARGAREPRVLVIGVGGGVDVMIALAAGARSVTAVEINDAMIAMVTGHFADYLGHLFGEGPYRDRVRLVHAEGRSYVRRSGELWDVIQLSGVDSFTALNTGAYTLSESYLYTVEAVQDFYERLAEDGFLSYSRFIMRHPRKPRETLRLVHIAHTALAELGVADPASRILVLQGFGWASTLVKKGDFTRAEVDALRDFARKEGFWGLVFDPLHPHGEPFPPAPRFDRRGRQGLARSLEAGAIPGLQGSRDEREALNLAFRALRERRPAAARRELDRLVGELPEERREVVRERARRLVTAQARRAAEADPPLNATRRDFATLLRGTPGERQAFLASYEYDLTPSGDDAPFFFNYYRYSGLWRPTQGEASGWKSPYHLDYPVGHLVLMASLVQITALAALLILLPLRGRSGRRLESTGTGRVFVYFAALGSGFMFVEIVLMQKLVLFLGHPTYAITVVLCALLTFAGVGALASTRLGVPSQRALRALGAIVPALILAQAAVVEWLLPLLLGWPLAARAAIAVAALAPLGLALGMPFPLGVRLLERRAPDLVAWAWAINAFLSVFSSIFCIALAMAIGFSAVLWIAAAAYAAGFAALASFESRTRLASPTRA